MLDKFGLDQAYTRGKKVNIGLVYTRVEKKDMGSI